MACGVFRCPERAADWTDALRPVESVIVTDYKVQLDVYNGPLDLLLYLIRRNELDIYDISIAVVTRQYCEYVECLRDIDPDAAAEFVVMATVLMEIKSRMLLPTPVEEAGAEEAVDPRMGLVRQLLEYKRFKDVSRQLGDAAEEQALRWPRGPLRPLLRDPTEVDLEDVQIWDLVAAFNQLLVAIGRDRATHDVVYDDTPISLHAADILDRLSRDGNQPFAALFVGRGKPEMIGLFLALLELIRQARVRVEQPDPLGPIIVVLLSAEPITVGSEWDHRRAADEPDEAARSGDASAGETPAAMEGKPDVAKDEPFEDEECEPDEVLQRLREIRTDVVMDERGTAGDQIPNPSDKTHGEGRDGSAARRNAGAD